MKVDLEHTNQLGGCLADEIKSLAEACDHEYYMSAVGSPYGNLERAKWGRSRILEGIGKLKRIGKEVSCLACLREIEHQLRLQEEAVLEIERVWKLSQ